MAKEIPFRIKLSSKPELMKSIVLTSGKAIIEVDTLENDYTRTCNLGDLLIVEPGRPQISAAKRYVVGIGDRMIYCKITQRRDKSKVYILGFGETNITDIVFWCNAKKYK